MNASMARMARIDSVDEIRKTRDTNKHFGFPLELLCHGRAKNAGASKGWSPQLCENIGRYHEFYFQYVCTVQFQELRGPRSTHG